MQKSTSKGSTGIILVGLIRPDIGMGEEAVAVPSNVMVRKRRGDALEGGRYVMMEKRRPTV